MFKNKIVIDNSVTCKFHKFVEEVFYISKNTSNKIMYIPKLFSMLATT